MCGIAGFVDKRGRCDVGERKKIVRSMLRSMQHRGGDSSGISVFGTSVVGHTRLSIVDVSRKANQPFNDSRALLAFNGEIFNHLELREEHLLHEKFQSHSDTATLFSLLKLLPYTETLKKAQGMYALSFLDKEKQEVLLAVDEYNIKPLYFIDTPDYFAWASEIKAFAYIPGLKFSLNQDVIFEYLVFRYIVGERTLFKGIKKLQGGEMLRLSLQTGAYEKCGYRMSTYRTEGSSSGTLEKALKGSVHAHLMSDVPVGLQLSGGVDSSLVAVLAAKQLDKRLHTFSIGLKDAAWNEFVYSDLVARKIGSHHHKLTFSGKDFKRLLPKITHHLDEPIVHPNTIAMYLLAKYARKHTKVLLTGEGADELFYGYTRYARLLDGGGSILFSNAFVDKRLVSALLKRSDTNLDERKKFLRKTKGLSMETKVGLYDMYSYLPHVLSRQDKASMAANVENRVPYLYPPVAQFGLGARSNYGEFGGKTPVKKIALKYLPKELVLRKKCGFGLPIAEWFRDAGLLKPYLSKLTKHSMIRRHFYVRKLAKLIDEHIDGEKDHSNILFGLVALMIWHDIFITPE